MTTVAPEMIVGVLKFSFSVNFHYNFTNIREDTTNTYLNLLCLPVIFVEQFQIQVLRDEEL